MSIFVSRLFGFRDYPHTQNAVFSEAINSDRSKEVAARQRSRAELEKTERKLEGHYDAIADGLRTPGLLQRLNDTEAKKFELETQLSAPAPSPVRLHPGLPEIYRKKVADLTASLKDDTIRPRALDALRGLIERVSVHASGTSIGPVLELEGAITAMIERAQPGALSEVDHRSVKVVAGERIALWRKRRCSSRWCDEQRGTRRGDRRRPAATVLARKHRPPRPLAA